MHIYCLIVVVSQESRHGLSIWVLISCTQGVDWAVISPEGLTGEEFASKFTSFVGRINFLALVWLRARVFCFLLAGGCLQLLQATLSSLFSDFPQYDWLLSQTSKENLKTELPIKTLLYSNTIMRVTLHYLCHILLFRNKSQVPPTLTGRRWIKGINKKARIRRATLQSDHYTICPSTREWIRTP